MLQRTLAVAFACLAAPLFAETILYVKPGATGSGASWDDAADLAAAVAKARENVPCAIYVAKGVYAANRLAVAPGTSLYGGFAGESADETVAARDVAADVTVVYGTDGSRTSFWRDCTGTDVLRDGAKVRVMNADGTFNAPDPTDEELFWTPSYGVNALDASGETATGESVVVDGFVFTTASLKFGKVPATVRNCRFFGCFHDWGIVWGSASFTVEDCAFDWCNGPAISSDLADGSAIITLRNVAVRHEVANNQRGLGVYAPNVTLDVEGCAFERNYNVRAVGDGGLGVVHGNDSSKMRIRGTRFVENLVSSNASAIVILPNYNPSVVSNCLFLSNRVVGDRGDRSSAAACILNARRNDHVVDACSFVSNVVDRTEAKTKSGVTLMPCSIVYSCYVAPIRRCTFDGNRVSAAASAEGVTPVCATLYSEGGNDSGCLFGNTFSGNDAATGEIVLNRHPVQTSGVIRVFNSIFWHPSDSYVPVARLGTGSICYRHCVVKNLPADADWIVDLEANRAGDPLLDDRLTAAEGLLVRCPGTGAARHKGIPLYYDSSEPRKVAYQGGSGYVRCDTLGSSLLTAPYTAIPDALGQFPRARLKPDIGAVQASASGFLLLLR